MWSCLRTPGGSSWRLSSKSRTMPLQWSQKSPGVIIAQLQAKINKSSNDSSHSGWLSAFFSRTPTRSAANTARSKFTSSLLYQIWPELEPIFPGNYRLLDLAYSKTHRGLKEIGYSRIPPHCSNYETSTMERAVHLLSSAHEKNFLCH